jgi:hypothetical protein
MSDDPILRQFDAFTPEQVLNPGYGQSYLFFVGRDDVHSIMMQLFHQEKLGVVGNMFGYDDDDINQAIIDLWKTPSVSVQITLDKSQAGGVHERKIIAADEAFDAVEFNNSFAIGTSESHQISHTKGFVFLGQNIWFEGSTNLSASGEGIGISLKADVRNPVGFKAQNNTLHVSTNHINLTRFRTRLDYEHKVAVAQNGQTGRAGAPPHLP